MNELGIRKNRSEFSLLLHEFSFHSMNSRDKSLHEFSLRSIEEKLNLIHNGTRRMCVRIHGTRATLEVRILGGYAVNSWNEVRIH